MKLTTKRMATVTTCWDSPEAIAERLLETKRLAMAKFSRSQRSSRALWFASVPATAVAAQESGKSQDLG
jgi:hypothetical protein